MRGMTQQQKESVRHHAWKWIGSLFLEEKNGHWAMSLTRVLTLAISIQAMWIWTGLSEQKDLPEGMLWVLLALLGAKTGNKIADAVKR